MVAVANRGRIITLITTRLCIDSPFEFLHFMLLCVQQQQQQQQEKGHIVVVVVVTVQTMVGP